MNKVALVTVGLGEFNIEPKWIEQSIPADLHAFNETNFPSRMCAMTPRLQARIAKIFCWQMVPDYDYYIWFDNSLEISTNKVVEWFMERLGEADAVFLRHPDRKTVKEEWEYINKLVSENHYYLAPRYKNELGNEELKEIYSDPGYKDDLLIASTAFMIRNNDRVKAMMKEWWYHTSRYHIVDQLGLPYSIYKSGCKVNIINDSYLHLPNLKHIRKSYKGKHE